MERFRVVLIVVLGVAAWVGGGSAVAAWFGHAHPATTARLPATVVTTTDPLRIADATRFATRTVRAKPYVLLESTRDPRGIAWELSQGPDDS